MLQVKRQAGQVDLVAGDHALMHRRVGRTHLDHRLRIVHAPRVFLGDVAGRHAEGRRQPRPTAGYRADDLELLGAGLAEQRGARRCLDKGADLEQRDRLVMDIHLADLDQPLDEAPEPELLEIDIRGRQARVAIH